MNWDEKVESMDWSSLQAEGATPAIPVELLETRPIDESVEYEIGEEEFNLN